MSDELKIFRQYLTNKGWKQYPSQSLVYPEVVRELWCKELLGVPELKKCTSNEEAPVLCLDIVQFGNGLVVSAELINIYIRGQVEDATWYTLEAYSLSFQEVYARLHEITAKLCIAWNTLHTS